MPPCSTRGTTPLVNSTAALLLLFNGRFSTAEGRKACARAAMLLQSGPVQDCFVTASVKDARLAGNADTYDKHRQGKAWTAGPNNLFYRAVSIARRQGYTHLLQMEPDVAPFRAGWVERARCLAMLSDAWVIGSALQANCTRDETSGTCVETLPAEIAEHVNGNAIYSVADEGFAAHLQATRHGHTARMPFDLALHLLRSRYTQSLQRQLLHRFQHTNFVVNLGTTLPDTGQTLRARHPQGFLVHSSALAALPLESLLRHLTTSRGRVDAGGEISWSVGGRKLKSLAVASRSLRRSPSRSLHDPGLNLAPLKHRAMRLGKLRVALTAFVAGTKYRHLCENHISHLHRVGIDHYVLVALDPSTLQWLNAANQPVIDATHLIEGVSEGGADEFGTSEFFAINGARYRALVTILRAGFSLFVLDLDVVILRDPLPWLKAFRLSDHDMLLQSDARDGVSTLEFDPDLIERRLGLRGATNWTYVNGGTFFVRATTSTVAFFQRTWDQLRASKTALNEQDMLNRALAAGPGFRWSILPPNLFPNGFVHFLRPFPVAPRPVLVHANWVNGVEEKIYHLREAGLWALDDRSSDKERILSLGDGIFERHLGFAAHRRALRDALALAQVLNRTLLLPRLPISRRGLARSRTIAHYFDYAAFRQAFPRHREHGAQDVGYPLHAKCLHLDVGHGDGPPADGAAYTVVQLDTTKSVLGLTDFSLSKALAPYSAARSLHVWTTFQRFGGRFADPGEQAGFGSRVVRGLRPAPRLQFLAQFVLRSIRRKEHAFDCIDAASYGAYEDYVGARLMGIDRNMGRPGLQAAARALNATPDRQLRVLVLTDESQTRLQALRAHAERHLGAGRPLWIDDHIPKWYEADFDTPTEHDTHARSIIELHVCARARRFVGNLAAPSTHAVCQLRVASARVRGGQKSSVSPRQCIDALGRRLANGGRRAELF